MTQYMSSQTYSVKIILKILHSEYLFIYFKTIKVYMLCFFFYKSIVSTFKLYIWSISIVSLIFFLSIILNNLHFKSIDKKKN